YDLILAFTPEAVTRQQVIDPSHLPATFDRALNPTVSRDLPKRKQLSEMLSSSASIVVVVLVAVVAAVVVADSGYLPPPKPCYPKTHQVTY
ncbi:hypothetical protein Hamer_G022402, partial [Homarus americanus]